MKKPLVLTDSNFNKEVLESEVPVLADFWASWCPPCKMVEPALQALALELDGSVKIAKINVDQNPAIAALSDIQGVPTFILFVNGKSVARSVGAQSKKQLLSVLQAYDLTEV